MTGPGVELSFSRSRITNPGAAFLISWDIMLKDFFKEAPKPLEPEALPDRISGKIIHVQHDSGSKKGGYGFITSPKIPYTRIYFYWTALLQDTLNFLDLKEGMNVEFTPKKFERGWRAIKMRVVE